MKRLYPFKLYTRFCTCIFLVFLLTSHILYAQQSPEKTILILAGKLYDAEKNIFLKDQQILVKGNSIQKVGANLGKINGAEVIDLSDCTIIPGLIDAHTHLLYQQRPGEPLEKDILENSDLDRSHRATGIAKSFLEAGITTVRDLGNSGQFLDVTLRNAINKGWVSGPRMYVSGPILGPQGGQFFKLAYHNKELVDKEYRVIKGVEDARSAVREHIANNVDLIKILAHNAYLSLSQEEMRAIVETAHQKGLIVTAHATNDKAVREAVLAGVDGIEHGYDISDSTLELMSSKGVYLVPTDGSFHGYRQIFDANEYKISDEEIKSFVSATADRLQRAIKKGVKIVYGSDQYIYNHKPLGEVAKDVLIAYYETGVSVEDVLKFATINGAQALGQEGKIGVIKPNAYADIVALRGDLKKEFKKALFNVKFVMKNGQISYK